MNVVDLRQRVPFKFSSGSTQESDEDTTILDEQGMLAFYIYCHHGIKFTMGH